MENQDHLPATKGDLRHFATKDDFRNLATKDDIRGLHVKIDATSRRMALELVDVKARIDHIGSTVMTKEDFKKLSDMIEKISGKTAGEDFNRRVPN